MGNRWFRKYCDAQRAPWYFFGTDIVPLCHNMGGGGLAPPVILFPSVKPALEAATTEVGKDREYGMRSVVQW